MTRWRVFSRIRPLLDFNGLLKTRGRESSRYNRPCSLVGYRGNLRALKGGWAYSGWGDESKGLEPMAVIAADRIEMTSDIRG